MGRMMGIDRAVVGCIGALRLVQCPFKCRTRTTRTAMAAKASVSPGSHESTLPSSPMPLPIHANLQPSTHAQKLATVGVCCRSFIPTPNSPDETARMTPDHPYRTNIVWVGGHVCTTLRAGSNFGVGAVCSPSL